MFLEPRGHRLEYLRLGEITGSTPLLFLHEGLGSIELWRTFPADVVAKSDHPGLVFSRYGHGRSDPITEPRGARFMHEEALVVLPTLIDQLVGEPPILVGHSDGASISLIYAGSGHPVKGLVLIAPHVMLETQGLDQIAFLSDAYDSTDLADRIAKYHDNSEATFRAWADVWLSKEFSSWNLEEFLPGITCPIVLIQSKEDDYGTLKHLDIIESSVSGPVDRLEVEGMSHSPHLSHSAVVVEATVRFIKQLDRSIQ